MLDRQREKCSLELVGQAAALPDALVGDLARGVVVGGDAALHLPDARDLGDQVVVFLALAHPLALQGLETGLGVFELAAVLLVGGVLLVELLVAPDVLRGVEDGLVGHLVRGVAAAAPDGSDDDQAQAEDGGQGEDQQGVLHVRAPFSDAGRFQGAG